MGECAGYGKSGRYYRASGGDLGGEKLGSELVRYEVGVLACSVKQNPFVF